MFTFQLLEDSPRREPWNKGKLVGQRRPLKPKEIWGIRIRLQMEGNIRDLALLNLAIDSKLRGCDLVRLRVADVTHSGRVMSRANVMQRKTGQPVQFEITEETQESISAWIEHGGQRRLPFFVGLEVADRGAHAVPQPDAAAEARGFGHDQDIGQQLDAAAERFAQQLPFGGDQAVLLDGGFERGD